MSSPLLGIGMDSNRSQLMALQRIESEISHATVTQIRDSLGAAIGIFGSALSGNIRTVAVGLYKALE
ncbi:hypothetical protein AB4Z28_10550 [Pseudomonas sp. PAB10]